MIKYFNRKYNKLNELLELCKRFISIPKFIFFQIVKYILEYKNGI